MKNKPIFWSAVSILILLLVSLIDLFTGYEFELFVFYYIPVAVAALFVSSTFSYSLAVGSALCWFIVDTYSQHPYSTEFFRVWNTGLWLISFLLISAGLSKIVHMIESLRTANNDLEGALVQVKKLEGILHVCASCKRIRDDKGQWGQLESYIRTHSEADFSHDICPDCMSKLYPDYAERIHLLSNQQTDA